MKNDEYLKKITNYIFDSRYTRALLIDGDWGCGKTFFVKNILIPEIEKTETNQRAQEKEKYYKTLLVSLYGISSVDSIQDLIYSALVEKYAPGRKDIQFYPFFKNASLFGTKIIKGVADYFNVGESTKDIVNIVGDRFLSAKKESIILIFDDIERCQIDIVELMGFLNNLCENNGYRVIIIANEKEIARNENEVAASIQKQTALLDLYGKAISDIQNQLKGDGKKTIRQGVGSTIEELRRNRIEVGDARFRKLINEHSELLFEKNNLYERTKEKLIGLTIHFESNIEEAYEEIAHNVVSGELVKYIIQQKNSIVSTFAQANHKNLRTLISAFIAADSIICALNSNLSQQLKTQCDEQCINIDNIVDIEKQRVLIYIVRTAIQMAENKAPYQWKDTRFGSIGSGFFIGRAIIGYAFVDEYWTSLVAEREVISEDFTNRITELLMIELQSRYEKDHSELSLFKLSEWYLDKDENVEEYIRRIKTELADKKYYPQEFKDILCILIRIKNPNFGMIIEQKASDDSVCVYDAIDDSTRIPEVSESETVEYGYKAWNEIRIDDYVELMIKYFERDDVEITRDMLRMLTTDARFAKEYRQYIQPILDKIEDREIRRLNTSEEGINLLKEHGNGLFEIFKARKNQYISMGQFLTLYGFDAINEVLLVGDPKGIFNLADAINVVYSLGNLRDFFAADYEIVNRIWTSLKKDREEDRLVYNKEKSRTKEIALRRIESDFLKYRNSLSDPHNEV